MAAETTELGRWIERLFHDILVQPDDELSAGTIKENFDPVLVIGYNGMPLPLNVWMSIIAHMRAQNHIRLKERHELVANRVTEDGNTGSVAHRTVLELEDKESGVKKEATGTTIINVTTKDGKRCLVGWHEVAREPE